MIKPRAARRLAALFSLLAGLLGTAFLLAGPASAHASVVASDPADGARLNAAPRTVTITFDESVGLGGIGYLHVTNQAGRRVDAGDAVHPNGDATRVANVLTTGLGDGTYTASFRVVSADSHPAAGTIRFVVGNGALVRGSVGGATTNHVTTDLLDVVRWVSYAGFALLGGAWLLLTVWPAGRDDLRARRLVWTGWAATAAGGVIELLLQGPYAAGLAPQHLLDRSLIDATLHSEYGQLHCGRLVLLGLLALVFAGALQADARPVRWEAVAGVAWIAIAWTFSAGGHAGTTSPAALSVAADVAHLMAMSAWIGGLVLLVAAVLPRREPDEIDAVLPVFSAVAFGSVSVLAVTGTYAAWRGVGTVDAVFTTTYGLLVVAKIVLFVGLVSVGNMSRLLVRHRVGRPVAYAMTDVFADQLDGPVGEPITGLITFERLRRSVLVEAAVGLIVLALTAVLVTEPRGKEALATQHLSPVSASAPLTAARSLTVTADPGTHGNVTLTLDLGVGPAPTGVTATATQGAAQLGPLPIRLTRASADVYEGTVNLPVAGRWRIDLVVTTAAFDATATAVTLSLH